MLISFFGLDSIILPILFFSLYCLLAGFVIFLLILIFLSLENSRLTDSGKYSRFKCCIRK